MEINWAAIFAIACVWAIAFTFVMFAYFDYKMKVELAKMSVETTEIKFEYNGEEEHGKAS